MAKGIQLAPGENLAVLSMKVLPATRRLMGDLVTVHKGDNDSYSQRELLDDMLDVYREARPELFEKVGQLQELLGGQRWAMTLAANMEAEGTATGRIAGHMVRTAAAASMPEIPEPVAPPAQTSTPGTIQTVKYLGREGVHIYDPTRRNLTGCSLAGHIDPDTIQDDQDPATVDCKKCRYCRKEVFV